MSFDSPKLILLVLATIAILGCKSQDDLKNCEEHSLSPCETDPNMTNIRVKNISNYSLCNVEVAPGAGTFNHGIVAPNATTCYRATVEAYQSTYVHFTVGDSELVVQPIDHVGDTLLGPGNFTLSIDVTSLARYGGIVLEYTKD